MKYPNIFMDTDDWSETYGQWCVRIDEGSSYDGMSLREAAELVMQIIKEDMEQTSNVVSFPFGENVVRFDG